MAKKIKNIIESLEVVDLPPVTQFLSTGCTILDLAITDKLPGGFGAGRISHIFGPESTAKTVLAQEPLGAAQRMGGIAHFVDVEYTLDKERAHKLFGLSCNIGDENWEESHPKTIEELFDGSIELLLKGKDKDSIAAMSIDSLSALPSEKEAEDALNVAGFGTTRARQLSTAFRKYIRKIAVSNVAVIFIDQTRKDIGSPFNAYTVSGGEALKFYASTRVQVSNRGKILNKHKMVIGVNIGFKVVKNKIGPPFREGIFRLIFDYGIDNVGTNIQWYTENSTNCPKGSFLVPCANEIATVKGLGKAIKYVEDNNLEEQVIEAVEKLWRVVYEQEERKPKER